MTLITNGFIGGCDNDRTAFEMPFLRWGCKNVFHWNCDYLTGYISALSAVEGMIAEQPKVGEWIPCSARMPEIYDITQTSEIVLVCSSDGFQYMAFWCGDSQWRFCECGTKKEPISWSEIAAWMPLPEPYKGVD